MKSPSRKTAGCWALLWVALALPAAVPAQDAPLVLLIQPTQREDEIRRIYQPLLEYLEKSTGARFALTVAPNFLAHWEMVRRNTGYELALDDAHFTDYRVQKFGFEVLAKAAGTTSYSLAIARRTPLRNPLELVGRKVASYGPPSIGATRLNSMFPNPSRQPAIIEITSPTEGLTLLIEGKVVAAMLPSSALADSVNRDQVNVISTAEPAPNMALSASRKVNTRLREKIRVALLRAARTVDGSAMLRDTGIERFEPASATDYAGHSRILRDTWGY
jgi:ABC-type phosphate/phosphonate transport system substrate-binding protein